MSYKLLNNEVKHFIEKEVNKLAEGVVNKLHLQLTEEISPNDPEFYQTFEKMLDEAQELIIETLQGE